MRILLVEDEIKLGASIESFLDKAGYAVDWVHDVKSALQALAAEHFDLIILDLGLPDRDGIHVVRELRRLQRDNLVLVVSARETIGGRVECLDAGADDYMVKPVAMSELAARIRSLTRQQCNLANSKIQLGLLQFDTVSKRVTRDGEDLAISASEWSVLEYLALHSGKILSKEKLLQAVSNWNAPLTPNAIEMLVHRLRKKIIDGGVSIHTVRGLGYMLSEDKVDL